MDSLIKQARVRFADREPQRESSFKKDRRITPQKSVSFSFKEDKKSKNRPSSLQRTFSDRMRYGKDTGDGEFEVAVAAAAYAVSSLSEDGLGRRKKKKRAVEEGWERGTRSRKDEASIKSKSFGEDSATKNKNLKEDDTSTKFSESGRISRWFSGIYSKEDESSAPGNLKNPEKGMSTTKPSFKKTPTLSERYMNEIASKKIENEKKKPMIPPALSTPKPTVAAAAASSDANRRNWKDDIDLSRKKKPTKAEAWEIAENEKIMKRYEKMYATILEWETEKKKKAKRKLDKKERTMELRRTKTLQKYRNDIARIDKVAGGARSLADERRRNDESKLREKARQVRMRGNRTTCFGF